jgi:hypothetical protein
MRFWLKAIAEFFGGLFTATVEDDLGTSRPEAAPAPRGDVKPAGDHPWELASRNQAIAYLVFSDLTGSGQTRIRKAFQQYADERIK